MSARLQQAVSITTTYMQDRQATCRFIASTGYKFGRTLHMDTLALLFKIKMRSTYLSLYQAHTRSSYGPIGGNREAALCGYDKLTGSSDAGFLCIIEHGFLYFR